MHTATRAAPVVERIRHAILDGTWLPGQRLAPVALGERYETSTTVIREALTRLVGENLIEARTNRGFFVPELDLREFRDVNELRCATETLALKLAIERGDLHWETNLIAAHHRMTKTPRRLAGNEVNDDWRLAHWGFHEALLAGCGCDQIMKVAAGLAQATELYRAWAAPTEAASERNVEQEHQRLVNAAVSRDVERATSLLRKHFEETARIVVTAGLARASAVPDEPNELSAKRPR
jgi:DNA-binding GntR family transcriptional regulator